MPGKKIITRILLFIPLLIAGTAFGQSKKDLQAQVVSYQQKLDSINRVLEETRRINDSLSNEIRQKERDLADKQSTLDYRTKELETLQSQMETQQSSKQEPPASKLTKTRNNTNPFANSGLNSSGGERASLGNDNHRYLIKQPDVSALSSEKSCEIVFRVMVAENGEILEIPVVIRSMTTTSDEALIQKVSKLVKSQAKYNPLKGVGNSEETILIRIKPH